MLPSELTRTIEQFIVYVHLCIYVYHTNVFEADNIYKNPRPNVISPIYFLLFIFRSGAPPTTLSTALDHSQIPSWPRQLHTCARLMQGWVASAGWPPKQTSWLCRCRLQSHHQSTSPGYVGVWENTCKKVNLSPVYIILRACVVGAAFPH